MKKHQEAHGVEESEEQLISRAQEAVSQCRWVVGECASKWTKRYARGRTDADFASLLGLTGDQVFQRRRVWDKFADIQDQFNSLRWSHYYAALTWDDAAECLGWAEETRSTVAEMRAWRRARRGEDLTTEAMSDELTGDIRYVPSETEWVQDPSEFGKGPSKGGSHSSSPGDPDQVALASVARQMEHDGDNYTPFRKQAGSAAPKESGESATTVVEPRISPEQLVKRLTSTLDRCVKVLTPEFAREFRKLPEPLRNRFIKVVGELSSKAGDMM